MKFVFHSAVLAEPVLNSAVLIPNIIIIAGIGMVVYNHWTGTVDWNCGMEWWNRKFGKMRLEDYEVWEKDIHDIV